MLTHIYDPDFPFAAYQNIYAAKGNMTAGVDEKTIDAMSRERIVQLIEQLKMELFFFGHLIIQITCHKKRPVTTKELIQLLGACRYNLVMKHA